MPKADNLPPSCAVVTKSGSLNFLEPSGSLQACNGTAFYLRAQGDERNYLPLRLQCPSSNTTPFDFETAKSDAIV